MQSPRKLRWHGPSSVDGTVTAKPMHGHTHTSEDPCHAHAGQHEFELSTIAQAADGAIAWTQSVIDDVNNWVPPGSKDFVFIRSRNPRGWVQGAFLVGMKDWAAASQNESHWEFLLVSIHCCLCNQSSIIIALCLLAFTVTHAL